MSSTFNSTENTNEWAVLRWERVASEGRKGRVSFFAQLLGLVLHSSPVSSLRQVHPSGITINIREPSLPLSSISIHAKNTRCALKFRKVEGQRTEVTRGVTDLADHQDGRNAAAQPSFQSHNMNQNVSALVELLTKVPEVSQQLDNIQVALERNHRESAGRHDEILELVRSTKARVDSIDTRLSALEGLLSHVNETCDTVLSMCKSAEAEDGDGSGGSEEEEGDGSDDDDSGSGDSQDSSSESAPSGSRMPAMQQLPKEILDAFVEFMAARRAKSREQLTQGGDTSSSQSITRRLPAQPGRSTLVRGRSQPSAPATSAAPATTSSWTNLLDAAASQTPTTNTLASQSSVSSNATPRPTASAPSGHISGQPVSYKLNRKIKTVSLLWKEWYQGLEPGLPSVTYMDSVYKHHWRSSAGERKYFGNRKVIIEEIHAMMQVRGCDANAAIRHLDQVKGKKSLLRLSKALKKQRNLGQQPGELTDAGSRIFEDGGEEEDEEQGKSDEEQEDSEEER